MRWHSLLTRFAAILVAQQLISTWFLFDFFVTRDSLTASNLWRFKEEDIGSTTPTLSFAVDVERKKCQSNLTNHHATFDKLIFIVIDALGSSFIPMIDSKIILPDGLTMVDTMPFVMDSLRRRTAMGFVAKAATPTVTMPRVKALLSGTIPSFVDIVHNLAHDVSKFDDDNIIRVAKSQNKTLVFYGDDTWLSLFRRSIFARAKETYSFFANDYTTVDTNVTEKALPETTKDNIDWDFLILHYLGLDHIGHVFGTNENSLIDDKLSQMDKVIKQINDNMSKKQHKTLVVVCGDHGMSREGNHGGGSDLEANTAILFLPIGLNLSSSLEKTKISHPHIKQVDLAVTLSLVLGIKIPTMSKGVAIEPFLDSLWKREEGSHSKLTCALLSNLIQIGRLLDSNKFEIFSKEEDLVGLLNKHLASHGDQRVIAKKYHRLAMRIQESLLQTIASRGYPYLITSLLILTAILTTLNLKRISLRLLLPTISSIEKALYLLSVLAPIIVLGSTGFIENEQHFWPLYSMLSFVGLCCLQKNLTKSVLTIDSLRGSLFIAASLITNLRLFSPSFEQEMSSNSSYVISIVSVIILCNFLRQNSSVKKYRAPMSMIIGFVIMFTKHVEESRATSDQPDDVTHCALVQRLGTSLVVIFSVIEIIATRDSLNLKESEGIGPVALIIRKLASGWICVIFLLSRRRDFVFLMANVIMETSLNSICSSIQLPLVARTIVYYNFAQAAFYNQGNSNSFSSIDVMPAFFGQTSYNIYISIPLVAIGTYATQIYWIIKLFQRIQDNKTAIMVANSRQLRPGISGGTKPLITTRDSAETSVKLTCESIVMRNFLSLCYYMFVCMWLRNHLFIWSVLSPKLIYHFVTNNIILTVVLIMSSLSNLQRLFANSGYSKIRSPLSCKMEPS